MALGRPPPRIQFSAAKPLQSHERTHTHTHQNPSHALPHILLPLTPPLAPLRHLLVQPPVLVDDKCNHLWLVQLLVSPQSHRNRCANVIPCHRHKCRRTAPHSCTHTGAIQLKWHLQDKKNIHLWFAADETRTVWANAIHTNKYPGAFICSNCSLDHTPPFEKMLWFLA